jgi:hypothetical protein
MQTLWFVVHVDDCRGVEDACGGLAVGTRRVGY